MSAFLLPAPGGAAAATSTFGVPMLIVFCAVLVLLVQKVLVTNVPSAGHRRLSSTLDVGLGPLSVAAVVLAGTQLVLFLNRAA